MTPMIEGLHHVTAIAGGAVRNNAFYTGTLGLRRVKTTVNFDDPGVYHLYYGDESGLPGTVMTCFPYEGAKRGRRGRGEVSVTAFSVPRGSLTEWRARLERERVPGLVQDVRFDAPRLVVEGPDGECLALVEGDDARAPWTGGAVDGGMAIRGLHSVTLRLAEAGPTAELLSALGYRETGREGRVTRLSLPTGNGSGTIDIDTAPAPPAEQGAGSVHHVAFAVPDLAVLESLRAELVAAGIRATPPVDRTYFRSVYFRSPGGVLFELATDGPGFTRDESLGTLGQSLKLPGQHEHLRERLARTLVPLAG